ncbi:MAG: ATP-dependent DNA helicase RecG [Candidatus Marinimicrobia bacterium]|nr:ATP-dependent DNA helicase RecG [Candidatus Neomarinimicrobiota bacterium]
MILATPVEQLPLIGPAYAKRLKKLGVTTVQDLLYHFPFRYLDYSLLSPIGKLQAGETVSLRGKVMAMKNEYTKKGRKIQKAVVADKSGEIQVIWFNQPFLIKTIMPGQEIGLSGKVDWFGRSLVLVSPEYEIFKEGPKKETIHTGRLVPLYHETYGISSKWLRSRIAPLVKKFVPGLKEFLPKQILTKHQLMEFNQALKNSHFPLNQKRADEAKKRFAFEELFLLQLAALQRKKSWQKQSLAFRFQLDQEKILQFSAQLPFELTLAQKRALREIFQDLEKDQPMNRLLEGDVGSGKTIVSAAAIYVAFLNHKQTALMAPTQILAQQHYQTLKQTLSPLGLKVALLIGAQKETATDFDCLVGTHALIYRRAQFKQLGLVVIDEQHRFGVKQRGELIKKNRAPHVLTMTATPIPRTIALTLYGDLDLSLLDEMPPGRQKIKTWVVPPQKRAAAYQWIRGQVKNKKDQAFIVCPLIEESAVETMQSVRAATSEKQKLAKEVFPDLKLGLLHGRLKSQEKEKIVAQFRKGKIDILVATPVVEVGLDIPTATVMLIEAAERFGLAQLHQLRGRVGRSGQQAYCLLFSESLSRTSIKRLKALEKINTGSELAELDLKLRGPGEIYGTQQHGFFNLKVASFSDLVMIKKTRGEAEKIIDQIERHPALQARLKEYTIKTIEPN